MATIVSPSTATRTVPAALGAMNGHDRLVAEHPGRGVLSKHTVTGADRFDRFGAAGGVDRRARAKTLERGRPGWGVHKFGKRRLDRRLAGLKGVPKLVSPPALPLVGLDAQPLAAGVLDDGQNATVDLLDLNVDRFDCLHVAGETLLQSLVRPEHALELADAVIDVARGQCC